MLGWIQPAEWHLWTGSWGLLRPLQSYKSSGHTLMLLMLLPAWELGWTAVADHPTSRPSPRHHTPESLPVLSSTYFVDVMYSCLPPLHPSSRGSQKWWGLKMTHERRSGQFCKRTDIKRMWRGGTLGPVYPRLWTLPGSIRVRVARKMSRKEGQSGDSATKQSVTLCAVVHPFHSPSPSHSLPFSSL